MLVFYMVELYLRHIKPQHWNHYNNMVFETNLPVLDFTVSSSRSVTLVDSNPTQKLSPIDYEQAYLYWYHTKVFRGPEEDLDYMINFYDQLIYQYYQRYPLLYMKTTIRELLLQYVEEDYLANYESFLNLDDIVLLFPPFTEEFASLEQNVKFHREGEVCFFTDLVDNLIRYRTQAFPIRTLYSPPVSYLDMDSINFVTYYDNQWHTYET